MLASSPAGRWRIALSLTAAALVAVPAAVLGVAQAAAPAATVPVLCADSVSSLTVFVDEVVSFGSAPSGCTVLNNSSTGNLDRVSSSGFVAFAAGTGAVFQLMTDGTTQYLVKVDVTILARPAPTPTPTATGSATPTATGTATPTGAGSSSPSATASPSPTPTDPPVLAQPDRPLASQRLTAKDITITPGLKPGQVAFFGPDGMPLQLLSMSGDTDGVTVIDDGTNYSTRPANWQRLGYGDLCWTYAGYAGTQGFVLPVANPPFSTVPANWVLTAAIVGTATGNVTYLEPTPGQVVDAGGRDAATLTLCANGYPNASAAGEAERMLRLAPADKGGGQYNSVPGCTNGQATGNKHCVAQPTWPTTTTNLGPTSAATAAPSPAATPTATPAPTPTPTPLATATPTPSPSVTEKPVDDAVLPVCRATGDPENPYRRELVRTSQIVPTGGDRLYPTLGWTDILPPTTTYPAGQNWLAGAALLFDAGCRITFVKPEPVQTVSGTSPGPTAGPGPEITGFSPVTIVEPVPQPSFTGYGPVYPWPPLQPVALTGSGSALVPTPTATPPTPTPSPTLTPPSPSPTLTPSPNPPSPTATPPSPSPTLTPPSPTVTVTPIAQPSFVDFGPVCRSGPCLLAPVLPPSIPYTTLIAVGPTATPSPTASATASPTVGPTASPTASPTSTPATGRVTLVLTNGPSTIAYTVPTGALVKVTVSTPSTTSTTTPTKPAKPSKVEAGRSRLPIPLDP